MTIRDLAYNEWYNIIIMSGIHFRILSLVEHFCLNFLMGLLPLFKGVNVLKATMNIIYCIGKMCRLYGLSLSTIKIKI